MTPAIELIGLEKSFGPKHAVRDLHLSVPRGALYGIIGPNGAGKSTSLRMLLSILFPDRGEVRVLGFDSALKAKDRIGYLPEERGVYRKMKVADFLLHMGVLKGLSRAEAKRRAQQWLERVGLPEVARKRCEELSKGMQQKVQFIAATIHEPELLILDEPFSGLDPVNMRLLKSLIEAEHARGCTVLFSTHVMPQAETMCDHIVMIHQGRKVLDDTLAGIRAGHQRNAIQLEPLRPAAEVPASVRALPGVTGISAQEGGYRIALAEGTDLPATLAALAREWPPAKLEIVRPSLEDIFIDIVGTDLNGEQGA
ncbi:MAG: ATP-binding cassette domain-containing protein [Xanthomonadales bacterium]|nr:ATP-binding cassette domain-containing protein [Xanthomonadales bacterium]